MTLRAEIQKRQQSVSDLKRQIEQITGLAGEDKKASIRVADALRFHQKTTRAVGAFFLNRSQQRKRSKTNASVASVSFCSKPFPLITAATGPNAEQILANIKYQLERKRGPGRRLPRNLRPDPGAGRDRPAGSHPDGQRQADVPQMGVRTVRV
jgi:hypothetical protein